MMKNELRFAINDDTLSAYSGKTYIADIRPDGAIFFSRIGLGDNAYMPLEWVTAIYTKAIEWRAVNQNPFIVNNPK